MAQIGEKFLLEKIRNFRKIFISKLFSFNRLDDELISRDLNKYLSNEKDREKFYEFLLENSNRVNETNVEYSSLSKDNEVLFSDNKKLFVK